MANVTVAVDTTVSPPTFTFTPDPVPIGSGKKETIYWIQAAGSNFDFAALAFDHPNPFSNVIVNRKQIAADDDNHRREDHKYDILVLANGVYYSTKDYLTGPNGPTIRNN